MKERFTEHNSREDNFELDPNDEILDPEKDLGDLWDKDEESGLKYHAAQTETFETVSNNYLEKIQELDKEKQQIVQRLFEEGLIDKRKKWESVVFLFKNSKETLKLKDQKEISDMMFREFKIKNERDRRIEAIGLDPIEKTQVVRKVKKKAA